MDSPSRIMAIDVALLPPQEVNAQASAINTELWQQRRGGFLFDDTHLPHITLIQQFTEHSSLPTIYEEVGGIVEGFQPLALRVLRIANVLETAHFVIEPTPVLRRLHEKLMDALAAVERQRGTESAFYSQDAVQPVRPGDIAWVTNFRRQASYERFVPHVTLGLGNAPDFDEPFMFTADRVAVCHLGRFCTCRTVLREWVLGAGKGSCLS